MKKTTQFHIDKRFYEQLSPKETDRFGQPINKKKNKKNTSPIQKNITTYLTQGRINKYASAALLLQGGTSITPEEAWEATTSIPHNQLTKEEKKLNKTIHRIARATVFNQLQEQTLDQDNKTAHQNLKVMAELEGLIQTKGNNQNSNQPGAATDFIINMPHEVKPQPGDKVTLTLDNPIATTEEICH